MNALWEILKSKYCVILLLFTLLLLGVSFLKSWKTEEQLRAGFLHDRGALSTYKFLRGAFNDQLNPGQRQVEVKITSFTTVDAREGGHGVCVCPICRMVLLHKSGCTSRCPGCHRDLMGGVYAGSGYLKVASASSAELKPVVTAPDQGPLAINGDMKNRPFAPVAAPAAALPMVPVIAAPVAVAPMVPVAEQPQPNIPVNAETGSIPNSPAVERGGNGGAN